MDKRMEELLNYERRVIEDRQQLSKLIEETDVNDTKLMKEKLEFFQQEIGYLNRQVEFLKCDMERRENQVIQQASSYTQTQTSIPGMEPVPQRSHENERMPRMEPAPQRVYENERIPKTEPVQQRVYGNERMPETEPIPQKISEKRDMEKRLYYKTLNLVYSQGKMLLLLEKMVITQIHLLILVMVV